MPDYVGLLFLGDLHLSSRAPGGRKDEYSQQILHKLEWCLAYAKRERLLPCLLGDIFHSPRERQLSYLGEISAVLRPHEVLAIWGNHDNLQDSLSEEVAFHLLLQAGILREVTPTDYWEGSMLGRKVQVVGVSYGQRVISAFPPGYSDSLTFLMLHADIPDFGGQDRLQIAQIDGIDAVINGHLHRPCEPIRTRKTEWFNPGSIARVSRGERDHPHALRFDLDVVPYRWSRVEVPCVSFAEAFRDRAAALSDAEIEDARERSIRALAAIQFREGLPGDGLLNFLKANEDHFELDVNEKLLKLAQAVISQ